MPVHRRRRILNHIRHLYANGLDWLLEEEAYLRRLIAFGRKDRYREGPPALNPDLPPFDIDDYVGECESHFRFSRDDIIYLAEILELPQIIRTPAPVLCARVEGLCIVLKRLAFPTRVFDLAKFFNRSEGAISEIFNTTLNLLFDRWSHLLVQLNIDRIVPNLGTFADACSRRGVPNPLQIVAFIDGTFRPVARPSEDESSIYSGKEKEHGLKYLGLVTPDGIICFLWGPFTGRRHDAELYRVSRLLETLEAHFNTLDGQPYACFADSAFPLSPHLMKPFFGAYLDEGEQAFNELMAGLRVSVEWSFRGVTNLFQALNWKQNQKILEVPVAQWYLVGALFTNLHACLRGNQISDLFDVRPPSVQEYLSR